MPSGYFGIYSGSVVNNTDPQNRGRLQLQVPTVTGFRQTGWAEPSHPAGFPALAPKTGDPVWVQFEGGDTSRPIWVGIPGASSFSGGGSGDVPYVTLDTTQTVTGAKTFTAQTTMLMGLDVSPFAPPNIVPGRISLGGSNAALVLSDTAATSWATTPTAGERWRMQVTTGTWRLWSGTDKVTVDYNGNTVITGDVTLASAKRVYLSDSTYGGNVSVSPDGWFTVKASATGFRVANNGYSLNNFYVYENGDIAARKNITALDGQVISRGGDSGIGFDKRGDSTQRMLWYYQTSTARLWHNVNGDRFTVHENGDISSAGAIYESGVRVYSANNPPPVTSVNTRTGAVTGLAEDSTVVHLTGTETISGSKTFSAVLSVTALSALGLTGAGGATRYVGGKDTGPPISGTFVVGDWVVARDGQVWICTAGGTPGTWTSARPSNMATTDTTQTISGAKTFSATTTAFTGGISFNTANQHAAIHMGGTAPGGFGRWLQMMPGTVSTDSLILYGSTSATADQWYAIGAKSSDNTLRIGPGTSMPTTGLRIDSAGMVHSDGSLSVPGSAAATRSIFTWASTDTNWRIGMSDNNTSNSTGTGAGFARTYATSHVQYISYATGSTQGFAVGPAGGSSHLEVRGSDGFTYIRGGLHVGGAFQLNKEGWHDIDHPTSGISGNGTTGWTGLRFNSRVNYGSDSGYILYQDNTEMGQTSGSGAEKSRLTIGVTNDSATANGVQDTLWFQGGAAIYHNVGNGDSEINAFTGGSYVPQASSAGANIHTSWRTNNTQIGYLRQDGYIYMVSYQGTSARATKDNIRGVSVTRRSNGENLIDRFQKLRPVKFRPKTAGPGSVDLISFVAEEAHEAVPEIVGYDIDGNPDSINLGATVTLLVGLVQQLRTEIDELKAKETR